ncbi:MAG: glyoxalase superfamily protein [Candidatus Dormibacteraeota bacterium]|nr:glyoxalase superfamily protein [Candidatus Dormibacteraeota bacterium]
MDWKLELVILPVSDIDRAKAFYVDQVGFHADHDQTVSDQIRFVQLTPPGSACSIAFGKGIVEGRPGSVKGLQIVVSDIKAAHAHLLERGVDVSPVQELAWGSFVYFSDPDGNRWSIQQPPSRQRAS